MPRVRFPQYRRALSLVLGDTFDRITSTIEPILYARAVMAARGRGRSAMQILAISDVYHPQTDEVATSLRTLLHELQAKGHAVTLIAPDYANGKDEAAEDIVRVSAYTLPFAGMPRVMKVHRVLELEARLRGTYDVLHIHTPWVAHVAGLRLARRLDLPIVESWSTPNDSSPLAAVLRAQWARPLAGWITRVQCRPVDGLVVASTGLREHLDGYRVRVPVSVVPTPIDVQMFQRGDGARFRRMHGIAPERPVLLHIGRLNGPSGLDFLLGTLREVRRQIADAVLVIAGAGPAEPYLRERAVRRDVAGPVIFVGSLDRASGLLDAYQAADCLVLAPAAAARCMVLREALASGLPVVSTVGTDTRDILTQESGALIAEENIAHFSAQVLRVLCDPEERARLVAAAREHVQQWAAALVAEQVLDCYRQAIAARAGAARAYV